jgi:hypothetical protein
MYFGSYDFMKNKLGSLAPESAQPAVHFTAGLIANGVGGLAWTPMDVVKQRMQVQSSEVASTGNYKSSMHGVAQVVKNEGVRGLYKGYVAGWLTFGPFSAVYFLSYE